MGVLNRRVFCACGCGRVVKPSRRFIFGHQNSLPESKENASRRKKANWDDPEWREKTIVAQTKAQNRPEVKLATSIKSKETNARLGMKQRKSEAGKKAANLPGVKEKKKAKSKEVMARPGMKEQISNTMKIITNDPTARKANSERQKIAQKKPDVIEKKRRSLAITNVLTEVKARRSKAQKEAQGRPKVREANSIRGKELWQNPAHIELQRISRDLRPNKPESFWLSILPERYPILKWEYTGDFTFWINGKNPDFVSKKYKLVIEYNSGYYHQDDIPGQREAIFTAWGWKTFIINDVEMMNMEKLYQRLDEFCQSALDGRL